MGDVAKADLSIDAKEQALVGLNRLKNMIEEREKCVLALKEELEKARPKNICWWDAKLCLNYSQTGGFQEAGTLCNGCFRVDQKRFVFLLEQIVPDLLGSFYDMIIKDEKEELIEDAWEEVSKEIQGIIGDLVEED